MRLNLSAPKNAPELPPHDIGRPYLPVRLDSACAHPQCCFRRRLFRWWRALLVWWGWYGIEHCARRLDVCGPHRAYAQQICREFDPFHERDW